jgi:hypothetical protein
LRAIGGYIVDQGPDYGGCFPYVVVDDKDGHKITQCNTLSAARRTCNGNVDENAIWQKVPTQSMRIITPAEYKEIFGRDW